MVIGTLMPHLLGVPEWGDGASAPEGADALCPHHLDILPFRHVTLRHVTSRYITLRHVTLRYVPPPMLPYGTEGCPGGEDIGHRPLREPMPYHPTPEPQGDGASGYR